VPEAVRKSWKPMVESFLTRHRDRIALALMVVDSRHEASELDLSMREWLEDREIPYVVVATKSDKLSASARAVAERRLTLSFGASTVCDRPFLVSVKTGRGIREIWKHLDTVLEKSPGMRKKTGAW
jgi:GTP-binding protein